MPMNAQERQMMEQMKKSKAGRLRQLRAKPNPKALKKRKKKVDEKKKKPKPATSSSKSQPPPRPKFERRKIVPNAPASFSGSKRGSSGGWSSGPKMDRSLTVSNAAERKNYNPDDEEEPIYGDGEESKYAPIIVPFPAVSRIPENPVEEQGGNEEDEDEDFVTKKKGGKKNVILDEEDDEMDEKEKPADAEMALKGEKGSDKADTSNPQMTEKQPEPTLAEYLERLVVTGKSDELFFVQMPMALPVLPKQDRAKEDEDGEGAADMDAQSDVKVKQEADVKENTEEIYFKQWDERQKHLYQEQLQAIQDNDDLLSNLPDEATGMLQIHKSGKISLKLGEVSLQVNEGARCAFHQNVFAVDVDNDAAYELGDLNTRLVCSLDVKEMLANQL